MAVDTRSLVYLIDPFWQGENINGKPLVGGYMEVYVAGTDTKYITWSDWDGARHPFRIPLKSDGRACILVEPQYTYDCYLYDSFGNLACSRLNVSPEIGGDVSVSGLTQVYHDETISGNGTPQEPIGVVSAGKVYEGIEPVVVNNDLDKISANHVPLGVQDPLYFVQDDEEGCIIGFSGQTIPEDVMSESALGFENNKITGYNGSAFSAGNEYEAGSYVDITDNTISVVNLPTSADVQTIVDVATSGLMPSGDYLTKESADTLYAPTGNYLTGLPDDLVYSADITGFATTAELDNKLDKADSANFLLTSDSAKFYPMDSNPSGYIYELPSDLATTGWVDSQGYLTGVDIPESAVWNATTQTVSANSAQWAGGTANPQIPVTGINGIKISESGDKVVFEVSGEYATTAQLADKQDSLSYGYHDIAISAIDESAIYDTSAHARINTLVGRISDLSSNKLDTTAFSDVSGTFLTAHQDLSDYQTTAGMTAYLTTGDSAEFMTTAERSDYIPTGVSSEFYTTANTANYISTIPDTYLQNTDLSTTDGKVTAISGIPLSAGGDVPEGVMVESGLEYNAIQEISGYNGSAIAQYGAEKQWLQHDDTIVHVSNSAQYAFGVNLSAVERLLGIDETVLWSNSAGAITATGINFVLSEPYTAFNKLKFVMRMDQTTQEVILLPNSSFSAFGIPFNYSKIGDGAWTTWTQIEFSTDTTARITKTKAFQYPWTSTAKQADGMNNNWEWTCRALTKIIGIGRKEV